MNALHYKKSAVQLFPDLWMSSHGRFRLFASDMLLSAPLYSHESAKNQRSTDGGFSKSSIIRIPIERKSQWLINWLISSSNPNEKKTIGKESSLTLFELYSC